MGSERRRVLFLYPAKDVSAVACVVWVRKGGHQWQVAEAAAEGCPGTLVRVPHYGTAPKQATNAKLEPREHSCNSQSGFLWRSVEGSVNVGR